MVVRNNFERVETMKELISWVRASGELSHAIAQEVRGKVQYAEGQIFCRAAAVMMPELRARASGKVQVGLISRQLDLEIAWAANYLAAAKPRKLLVYDTRTPLLVYTDAALEGAYD